MEIGSTDSSDVLARQQWSNAKESSSTGTAISQSKGTENVSNQGASKVNTDFTIQDMQVSQKFITALRIPQLIIPEQLQNPAGIFQKLAEFVENLLRKLTGAIERSVTAEDTEANEAETSDQERAQRVLNLAKELGLDLGPGGELAEKTPVDQASRVMDWALSLQLDIRLAEEIAQNSETHPAFLLTGEMSEDDRNALLSTLTYTVFLMRDSYLTGEPPLDPAHYGLGRSKS